MSDLHRFNGLKLLAHADRLDAIVAGELPYPIDWHIYPSNICNHKCVWCLFRQETPSGQAAEQIGFRVQLPRDLLLRAVSDAAETHAGLIHFSGGGEPLLNKHTLDAMALAQELSAARGDRPSRRLRVALSTNGRLLTPDVARQVDYIRVSLNAGTPEQHTATNHAGDGPGDWATILDRIADAVPHKRGDIGLGFVVDHQNYHDIPAFCRVADRLGVDFVHIRPAFYYDHAEDAHVRAAMPDALKLCQAAQWELRNRPLRIFALTDKFAGYWSERSYHACRAVLTGVCLRATGDFAVCQDRPDLTFGAAYARGASFADVWHSDEHRQVVASIHDGAGGELARCPRCVWGKRNQLIDAWERDDLRIALV